MSASADVRHKKERHFAKSHFLKTVMSASPTFINLGYTCDGTVWVGSGVEVAGRVGDPGRYPVLGGDLRVTCGGHVNE